MESLVEKSLMETSLAVLNESLKSLPKNTIEKLVYLWKSSHQMVLTSFDVSHSMMRDFIQLSRSNNVNIPNIVVHQICRYCCCIQIAGLSCRSKIQIRKRRKKANSMDAKQFDVSTNKRYKKRLVRLCLVCNNKTTEPCIPVIKKKLVNQPGINSNHIKSLVSTPTRFSFLDKFCGNSSNKKDGLNGDFISFSNTSAVKQSSFSSKTPDKKRRFSDLTNNTSTCSSGVNLLELQRSLKKQKRASKGGNKPIVEREITEKANEVIDQSDDINSQSKNQAINRSIDSINNSKQNASSSNCGNNNSYNGNNKQIKNVNIYNGKQINNVILRGANSKPYSNSNKPLVPIKPTVASTASLSSLQSLFRR